MEKDGELDIHRYVDDAFKSGILKFVILNAVCRKSTYPYDLYKRLKKVNFGILKDINKSEVYNILNSLEGKGLVKGASHLTGSKVQKEYRITKSGYRAAMRSRKVMAKNVSNIKRLIKYEFG